MISITDSQKAEVLVYFREYFPEFAVINDQTFNKRLNQVTIYIPGFIQTHINHKYPDVDHNWVVMREILANWVAHVLVLTDALAVAQGEDAMPMEQLRVASSLSEGGLSASFEQAKPNGQTPEAIYEYLSKTAYGDNVKMLLESCLTGAIGVLCV